MTPVTDPAAALANMDAISAAIGPGGDPELEREPERGALVIPAERLQAAWDRMLAQTAQAKRARTTRRGLTIAGYTEAKMYAQLVGFPFNDDGFGAGNAVHRALEAGRPTPLLPEHVPAEEDEDDSDEAEGDIR